MSKPNWQKNVELLKAQVAIIDSKIAKLDNKKPIFFKKRVEVAKAKLESEKAYLNSEIAKLKAVKKSKKISRNGVPGKVVAKLKNMEARKTLKIKKYENIGTQLETIKSSLTSGSCREKHVQSLIDKNKAKIERLKGKKIKIIGKQRTLLWPKYKKDNKKNIRVSRAEGKLNYKQTELSEINAMAKLPHGFSPTKTIASAYYKTYGFFYKKNVAHYQKHVDKLKNKPAKVHGARKYIKKKLLSIAAHL